MKDRMSAMQHAIRKDAERYRWARQQGADTLLDLYLSIPIDPSPEQFDQVIDDAMRVAASTRNLP